MIVHEPADADATRKGLDVPLRLTAVQFALSAAETVADGEALTVKFAVSAYALNEIGKFALAPVAVKLPLPAQLTDFVPAAGVVGTDVPPDEPPPPPPPPPQASNAVHMTVPSGISGCIMARPRFKRDASPHQKSWRSILCRRRAAEC